jgi:ADP-ribose pyrophosphatase YjhB (NUDIX family)
MAQSSSPAFPEETHPRRFTRFVSGRSEADGFWELPPNGLCLSCFVVLSPKEGAREALVGRIDANQPWLELGAIDSERALRIGEGWMLPSSHLQQFEPPQQAAERILREQLGIELRRLEGPTVVSEAYRRPGLPHSGPHWDIEFVYRASAPARWRPQHPAWRELRFVDPAATPRDQFARSHDEILEQAGFQIG